MIICCCHLLNDADMKFAIASGAMRPRKSQVYASLGYAAQCDRCAPSSCLRKAVGL